MADEHRPEDIRNVWQSQPVEGISMPLDEIRRRAGKFQSRIRRRNLREYSAAAVVVAFFGWYLTKAPDMFGGLGAGLLIAGILYVVWHLHRAGSARGVPQDLGAATCIEFHRRELERQRDLLRGVWKWYLGPMVPGLLVIALGTAVRNPGHLPHPYVFVAAYVTVGTLLFVLIGRWNRRHAQRLQQQIDELNSLGGPA